MKKLSATPRRERGFNEGFSHFVFVLIILSGLSAAQTNVYPHNAVVCERCHGVPRKFGSSSMIAQRVGGATAGVFIPVAEGGIHHRIGESFENANRTNQIIGNRVSLNLLGDGLIEAIADQDISANVEHQRRSQEGPLGAIVTPPVLESSGGSPVLRNGRFGWKSQHSSLLSSCADSLRNELGVRNRLYPDEYATHSISDSPTPFDTPNPRTGKTELDRLVNEIRLTQPPPREETLSSTPAAQVGERVFAAVGCGICHVPTYRTLPRGTLINGGTYKIPKFLAKRVIHPYSDFLLHDLGTGDGIPQAARPEFLDQSTANKFRTPPLWGLRFRVTFLMHDGDTPSLDAAIKRHAGEATKIRERYEKLSPEQKRELFTFLNSL